MKILFINLPYYGHVVPTIGLVRELIRAGCEVTYLLPFSWGKMIGESGALFRGYPDHRRLSEQMKNAYAAADAIAGQFDYIIYEQFFFLGKHLAEKHGKPAARIFTAPATNPELMREFISDKGPLSVFRNRWIARAFTKDIAKDIPLKTDNWLDEIIHNPPEMNLVYTFRRFQPYEADFPEEHFKFLGPSVYERKREPLEYTKGRNPLVYISLGTVLKGPVSFFQNCLEAFRGLDVDVIISLGPEFNVKRLKNIPANVFLYKSVPQLQVLKIADVFLTHGGMNSVSEALVSGTPMVVVPFVSDQPVNARCVQRLGVGKWMPYDKLSSSVIRETVLSVLHDGEIRRSIACVQEELARLPGNAGGAKMIMEHYEKTR